MTSRQAAIAADLFVAAIVCSVAFALAGLTWRIVGLLTYRPPPATIAARLAATGIDIGPIVALAPFGESLSDAPQPTTLPIELRGIVRTIPQEASSVLIAPSGGAAASYRVGGVIPQGATILSIGIDTAILGVGGHREILGFPKSVAAAPPTPLPGGPAILPGTTSVAGLPSPIAPPPGAASPQSLLDSLGASPVTGGYRIGESLSPAIRQAGLMPGDVIEQVNGTPLGNPAIDQRVLAAAARSGTLRVDLVRNGRRTTITLPLR